MRRARHIVITSGLAGFLASGCLVSHPGGDGGTSTTGTNSSGSGATGGTHGDSESGGPAPTTTTSLSGTTGDGCNFLVCDDSGADPGAGCDVFAHDCPAGQKCAPYAEDSAWDQVQCRPANGTDKPGDSCTAENPGSGIDSCIAGAICWDVDMQGIGICVALCAGSSAEPVCDPSYYCEGHGEALNLCLKSDCDPLLQDCMFTDQGCYPDADGFGCYWGPAAALGQANDPCKAFSDCDEGLTCAEAALVGKGCEAGPIGCCTPFCPFPDGACPNPDQQCIQWFDPQQLPANDPRLTIGYCGVPG